jgi:hypothetical protein
MKKPIVLFGAWWAVAIVFAYWMASAQTATFTFGETAVLPQADNGNAGLLLMQEAGLIQACQAVQQCFYVTTAAGKLRLGIYDNANPRNLEAAAPEILTTVANSWNCSAYPQPGPVLQPGTYRLAYAPSDSNLAFVKGNTSGPPPGNFGQSEWSFVPYGALPASIAAAPPTTVHWSHYVVCQAPGGPTPSPTPPPTTTTTLPPPTTTTTLPPPPTTTTTLPLPTTTTTTLPPSPPPSPSPSPSPSTSAFRAFSFALSDGPHSILVWETATANTCQVDYGLTNTYGTTTGIEVVAAKIHSALLGATVPLQPLTVYHFRARCSDSTSADATFSTGR